MARGTRVALAKFPTAGREYTEANEQAFRKSLELMLHGIFVSTNEHSDLIASGGWDLLGWTHDLVFSATDHDTVAWSSGTIYLPDGTTYSISGGNTGNITTVTYIYLDVAVSSTVLQTSTSASASVGGNKILIAVANDVASGKDAQFQVMGGADDSELVLITADVIAANTITANEIAANTITAAQIFAGTITATEIAANTITGANIASLNISTKTITADTGTIGGWTLSATALTSGSMVFNASTERILIGAATDVMTGVGVFAGLSAAAYQIRAGDPAGAYFRWSGTVLTVNGAVVTSPAVGSSASLLGWNHDMVFSATDHDTVAWASGTIRLQSGTSYSITGANTGNITALTYIYLDTDVSTTALQTTTTASTAVGHNKILVAVAEDVASGKKAEFQVFGGSGAVGLSKLIVADNIAANTITANEIAANTITAAQIAAGTITATEIAATTITGAKIAAATITADKLSVSTLSAITADVGTLTAGTISTNVLIAAESFTATNPTFTGTLIVEAGSGQDRILLGGTGSAGVIRLYRSATEIATIAVGAGLSLESFNSEGVYITSDNEVVIGFASGNFELIGLPTSNPGGSNKVWSDGGTLKIT